MACLFRFSFFFVCFVFFLTMASLSSISYFVFCVNYYLAVLWLSVPVQSIAWNDSSRNDQLCVERDIKLYTLFTIRNILRIKARPRNGTMGVYGCAVGRGLHRRGHSEVSGGRPARRGAHRLRSRPAARRRFCPPVRRRCRGRRSRCRCRRPSRLTTRSRPGRCRIAAWRLHTKLRGSSHI